MSDTVATRHQCVRQLSDPERGFVQCRREARWEYVPDPEWSHPEDAPRAWLCDRHDMRRTPAGYIRRGLPQ